MVAGGVRRGSWPAKCRRWVHHIRELNPTEVPPADLYVFSSPGRMGKPIGRMRRFPPQPNLGVGAKYALLDDEDGPSPDKQTGRVPTEEELARWQWVRPIMNGDPPGQGPRQGRRRQGLRDGDEGPARGGSGAGSSGFVVDPPNRRGSGMTPEVVS